MPFIDIQKGFTPARKLGSQYNSCGFNTYPIRNGYATAIGEGDPVALSAGYIVIATNAKNCYGVFGGCQYVDPVTGQLQFTKDFVAGTSSKGGVPVLNGEARVYGKVYDDEDNTYIVRTATSAVLQVSAVGRTYKMSAIGSVVNGRSQCVIDGVASAGTSGGYMVTVLGLYGTQNVAWGQGPIAVEVKLARFGSVQEL